MPSIDPTGKNDLVNPKTKNIRLYVKRVFISDDFDGELVKRLPLILFPEEKKRVKDFLVQAK